MESSKISMLYWALFTALVVGVPVRGYTTWRYRRALRAFSDPKTIEKCLDPPEIPYTVPWIGHFVPFMFSSPGAFWDSLRTWHFHSTGPGIFTIMVGGVKTHVITDPTTIRALVKIPKVFTRDEIWKDIMVICLDLPDADFDTLRMDEHRKVQAEIYMHHLSSASAIDEGVATYVRLWEREIAKEGDLHGREVYLYQWLYKLMFGASVSFLVGEKLIDANPELYLDLARYDHELLTLYSNGPRFVTAAAREHRRKLLNKMTAWEKTVDALHGGMPTNVEPKSGPWEPIFGSSYNKAKHGFFSLMGMSHAAMASITLGDVFAIASNVIPATGWMLMHIFTGTPEFQKRVTDEVDQSRRPDGSIDAGVLCSQPLLSSIYIEALRNYTDNLLIRGALQDHVLPIGSEEKRRYIKFKKGDVTLCPSWLPHHDPVLWNSEVSLRTYVPERHLEEGKTDAGTKSVSRGAFNKLASFGNVDIVCPGMAFAKREALATVAHLLTNYEFTFKGYVDKKKQPTDRFPTMVGGMPGAIVRGPGGDMTVKITRRNEKA